MIEITTEDRAMKLALTSLKEGDGGNQDQKKKKKKKKKRKEAKKGRFRRDVLESQKAVRKSQRATGNENDVDVDVDIDDQH